jgi:phenylacetic acid degradation operon negative regulatory protein
MSQSSNATGRLLALDEHGGRPLSARSVMASLLLGRRSASAPGRDLVRWCGLFGVAPGTARVALHRMTAAGELRHDGERYELVGALVRRQREQQAALVPDPRPWAGEWRMAIAIGARGRTAPVRAEMRVALRRARLAEWREGVWLRPDNVEIVEDPRAEWLTVRPDTDAVALAARLFDPSRWNREAASLVSGLDRATARLEAPEETAIAPAFLAGAAALRHIRADPILPVELCPTDWQGEQLRGAYRAYRVRFASVARDWFRVHG